MSKKKKNIPTGLLIGIGLAFIVFLLMTSILSANKQITKDIYFVKKTIPANTTITETNMDEYLGKTTVPDGVVLKNTLKVGDNITYKDENGKKKEMKAEEFFKGGDAEFYFTAFKDDVDILTKLEVNVPENYKNLSRTVPAGRRLVAIDTNTLKSFGGNLKKGDRVDLTFTITEKQGEEEIEKTITALQALRIFDLILDPAVAQSAEEGTIITPTGLSLLMTPEQVEIFHNLSGSGAYTLSLNSTKPAKYETDGITTNEVIDSLQDYFFQDLPETEVEKKEAKSTPSEDGSASSDSEQPSSTPNAHEGVYGFFDENNQAFYVTPDNPNYEEIKSQYPIGQEYDSADAASKEGFSPYQ